MRSLSYVLNRGLVTNCGERQTEKSTVYAQQLRHKDVYHCWWAMAIVLCSFYCPVRKCHILVSNFIVVCENGKI